VNDTQIDPLTDVEAAKVLRLPVAVVRRAFAHLALRPEQHRPRTWRWSHRTLQQLWQDATQPRRAA